MPGPRLVAATLLAAALCASPVAAAQPVGELTYAGCYTSLASGCVGNGIPMVDTTADVAVSPDGRSVYTVALGSNAVTQWSRDPATGALTRVACVTSATGCGPGADGKAGLAGAYGVALSADGRSVYVAGFNANAVAELARDPATGTLTYLDCVTGAATGCSAGNVSKLGLGGPKAVAVSPDGGAVFVASSTSGAIAWFARDGDSGRLTYSGCYSKDTTCYLDAYPVLNGATGVTVSPDGRSVYVAGWDGSGIERFARDPQAGTFFATGCLTASASGCAASGVASLTHPIALALDPAGRNLYSASQNSNHALAMFDRDAPTGALTFRGCFDAGLVCGGGNDNIRQLLWANGLGVSGDGRSVYLAADYDGDLMGFDRDPRDGSLTRRECFTAMTGCGAGRDNLTDLTSAADVAISPDGSDVYVVTYGGRPLLHFRRVPDTPPGCAPPTALATEPGVSVRAELHCGDANGDAFSTRFPLAPSHGALTLSADGGSVLYVPDHGYRGADRFGVQALDVYGTAGPTAVVTVAVDYAPPRITLLTLSPARFRAAGRGGTVAARRRSRRPPVATLVRYRLDRAATTRFTVTRALRGVRSGRRCVAPPRQRPKGVKLRRCTRTQRLGSFTRAARAGSDAFHFTGRLGRHALAPGRYTLTAVATGPGRKRSRARAVRFAIVG